MVPEDPSAEEPETEETTVQEEPTEEEIEADRMGKMANEMEHLRRENESLREVIAWLNMKMLNQEKDRRW